MNFVSRFTLLALPLLTFLGSPAQAQEVEVGMGLVCDTQEQVERFVALYDGDALSTANSVNAAEHNPTACAVSAMAYVRGRQLATTRSKDKAFQIVPILVLGIVTEAGVGIRNPRPVLLSVRNRGDRSIAPTSRHQGDSRARGVPPLPRFGRARERSGRAFAGTRHVAGIAKPPW